jgi:hypothetical protein
VDLGRYLREIVVAARELAHEGLRSLLELGLEVADESLERSAHVVERAGQRIRLQLLTRPGRLILQRLASLLDWPEDPGKLVIQGRAL